MKLFYDFSSSIQQTQPKPSPARPRRSRKRRPASERHRVRSLPICTRLHTLALSCSDLRRAPRALQGSSETPATAPPAGAGWSRASERSACPPAANPGPRPRGLPAGSGAAGVLGAVGARAGTPRGTLMRRPTGSASSPPPFHLRCPAPWPALPAPCAPLALRPSAVRPLSPPRSPELHIWNSFHILIPFSFPTSSFPLTDSSRSKPPLYFLIFSKYVKFNNL